MAKKLAAMFLVLVLLIPSPVHAQDTGWGEVFNADGTIRWDNLTDNGEIVVNEPWMPDIPVFGTIPATYHSYVTPTGNTVILPSPSTIFFAALAEAQGQSTYLGQASSSWGTGAGFVTAALGYALGGGQITTSSGMTYVNPGQFAEAVIAGRENIWSLPFGDALNMLSLLARPSLSDLNIYTIALLYTPDRCAAAPGGCPPEILALLATPIPTPGSPPLIPVCPSPQVIPGQITATGRKTAPNYPVVVGQDPSKTGVDLSFSASVAPTIYRYWTLEEEKECVAGPNRNGAYNCSRRGVAGHWETSGYVCAEHTETFNECIQQATGNITLAQSSRNWITNTLSLRYPGAYVKHPAFSFSGRLSCSWTAVQSGVQIQDPGYWSISVSGVTTGTPVSAPRPFRITGPTFDVYLKDSAIIE